MATRAWCAASGRLDHEAGEFSPRRVRGATAAINKLLQARFLAAYAKGPETALSD
jgi:hypothetical protein